MFDYFYSDPHFGHAKIIDYAYRPFKNVEHMQEMLVLNYNATVGPNDKCLWVGDCFFHPVESAKKIMNSLNGRKYLILGNHDKSPEEMIEIGFEVVFDRIEFALGGIEFVACHYPYAAEDKKDKVKFMSRRPRRKDYEGKILIHGHTHSPQKTTKDSINVGVDAWNYFPASSFEITQLAKLLKE